MKTVWETSYYKILITLLTVCMALVCATQTVAASSDEQSSIAYYYDDCIGSPVVEKGEQSYVRDYQLSRAKTLVKAGFKVEMMRHREVVIVIIPTEKLFLPGGSEITGKGARQLRALRPYLGSDNFYHIVVAGYSDNTGSPAYGMRRSTEWATAVADWLRKEADGITVYEFGMGAEGPLLPNNTYANRAVNRRIEILLVPDEGLIRQAR